MHYFLYLLNVACSAGQSALGKGYAVKGGKSAVFNGNKALSGLIVFLIIGLFSGLQFHLPTLLFGIGYGLFLSVSNHTGFRALSEGPMALTSVVASFSLIIPFVFGIALWGESISVFGIIGMLCLCTAIVLINLRKEKGITVKWAVYAFLTLICNGFCSVVQKYHQMYFPKLYRIEFLIAALFCVLITTLFACRGAVKTERRFLSKAGLIAGVMNGLSGYIVLSLSATENASVLFPVVSVANIIASCIIGRFVFKESLKPMQICGIVLGMASVLLLNL